MDGGAPRNLRRRRDWDTLPRARPLVRRVTAPGAMRRAGRSPDAHALTPMPPQTPASCTHELRPGITVCLHCRHAARQSQAARTRAVLLRAGGAVALLAGAVGAVALLRGEAGPTPPLATLAAATPDAGAAAAPAANVPIASEPASIIRPVAHATVPPAPPAAPPAAPRFVPIIPEGRTALRGGIVAVRTGDTVAVHFDTPATRTRRRDKFERLVRATLPAVFGPTADSALAAVPRGRLTASGDLLTELPTRGLRLATPNGTLALWPATRPGRDGPLVVTYVATIER